MTLHGNGSFAEIRFTDEGIDLRQMILRSHFEQLVADEVEQVNHAVDELLNRSGLQDDQIQAVLRTGGSAEIPIFIHLLGERFGHNNIEELNPFTSIVGGLALKGYEISQ